MCLRTPRTVRRDPFVSFAYVVGYLFGGVVHVAQAPPGNNVNQAQMR